MIAVVAMAQNRVIGDGTGLIWHLPDDLRRVKALTMGCPLIMDAGHGPDWPTPARTRQHRSDT